MAKNDSTLTQERLKELFYYNPETGIFTRLTRTARPTKIGDIAGGADPKGYWKMRVDGQKMAAHRLAWLYVYGAWPRNQIDHRNGNKSDNRIDNLRDTTQIENMQNTRKARSDNASGILGIRQTKYSWIARITINQILTHIGSYPTPELAHEAYLVAKRKFHSTCTI